MRIWCGHHIKILDNSGSMRLLDVAFSALSPGQTEVPPRTGGSDAARRLRRRGDAGRLSTGTWKKVEPTQRKMASTFRVARTRKTSIQRKPKSDYRFEGGGLNEHRLGRSTCRILREGEPDITSGSRTKHWLDVRCSTPTGDTINYISASCPLSSRYGCQLYTYTLCTRTVQLSRPAPTNAEATVHSPVAVIVRAKATV